MDSKKILLWAGRVIPAFILLQSLYYKFSAHPDSVALFTELGAEPVGRIGIGIMELIAGILLLVPKTTKYGALLALGLMVGAIGSHLTILGIEYNGDGGALFAMAVIVFVASTILIYYHRDSLIKDVKKIVGKS